MESEVVQLEPFVHQVGGHSSVLCFDAHTLCKPLISREHHFYKTMPDEMKEFTPEYRGVVEVVFRETSEGYMNLVAYPVHDASSSRKPPAYAGSSPSSGGDTAQSDSDSERGASKPTQKHRVRVKRSGSVEKKATAAAKMTFELINPLSAAADDSLRTAQNPWSLRCHRQQLDKMRRMRTDTGTHKFILLENLASHFTFPCILDLKMGTRQHGDQATEEKRRMQTLKCQKSTSGSLGVRICGMQIYLQSTGRFMCHDKYYGRQLTEDGFYQTLYQFLHDGRRLRAELLAPIIARLERLHATLAEQETFRFYSSSLLVMYDGQSDAPDTEPSVDVRMIDFAHVTHRGFYRDDVVHDGPDKGYLFGLETLINSFRSLQSSSSSSSSSSRETSTAAASSSSTTS